MREVQVQGFPLVPGVYASHVLLELVAPVEGHGAPLRLLEGAADPRGLVVGLGVPRQFVPPVEAAAADPAGERQHAGVNLRVVPGSEIKNFISRCQKKWNSGCVNLQADQPIRPQNSEFNLMPKKRPKHICKKMLLQRVVEIEMILQRGRAQTPTHTGFIATLANGARAV